MPLARRGIAFLLSLAVCFSLALRLHNLAAFQPSDFVSRHYFIHPELLRYAPPSLSAAALLVVAIAASTLEHTSCDNVPYTVHAAILPCHSHTGRLWRRRHRKGNGWEESEDWSRWQPPACSACVCRMPSTCYGCCIITVDHDRCLSEHATNLREVQTASRARHQLVPPSM
jgi:hypothetical protein